MKKLFMKNFLTTNKARLQSCVLLLGLLFLFSNANAQWCYKDFDNEGTWNYTLPAGCDQILVEAIGGGGGGAARSSVGWGAGGGGGAYGRTNIMSATAGSTLQINVGNGGWCQPSGARNNGGQSWVKLNGTTILQAYGGITATVQQAYTGAAGGAADGIGHVHFAGSAGAAGDYSLITYGTSKGSGGGGGAGGGAAPGQTTGIGFNSRGRGGTGGNSGNPLGGGWLSGGNGADGNGTLDYNCKTAKAPGGGGAGAVSPSWGNGCSGATGKVRVWFHIVNNMTVSAKINGVQTSTTTICYADETVLEAVVSNPYNSNLSYYWSNGPTTASQTIRPTTSTNYNLTVTNDYVAATQSTSSCATTKSFLVTINVREKFDAGTIDGTSHYWTLGSMSAKPNNVASVADARGGKKEDIQYQWRKNGSVISGATSSTYDIPDADFASAGTYKYTRWVKEGVCATDWVKSNGTYTVEVISSVEPVSITWNNWCYKDYTTVGSTGEFVVPAGCDEVIAEGIGGGGGGAPITEGVYISPGLGGGGGGGAYARTHLSTQAGTVYKITVGAGGPGQKDNTATGGSSYVRDVNGTTLLRAKGGNSAAKNQGAGATGGSSGECVGEVKYSGGNGASSNTSSKCGGGGGGAASGAANGSNASGTTGGAAGNAGTGAPGSWMKGGQGGNSRCDEGIGQGGVQYGGGGAGSKARAVATHNAGAGAQGKVRIWYHLNTNFQQSITPSLSNICDGENITLKATQNAPTGFGCTISYAWNTSENTQSITVHPSTTTNYECTFTYSHGSCSKTAKSRAVISTLPKFDAGKIKEDAYEICPEGKVKEIQSVSEASGGDGTYYYQWYVTISPIGGAQSYDLVKIDNATGLTYTPGDEFVKKHGYIYRFYRYAHDGSCQKEFAPTQGNERVKITVLTPRYANAGANNIVFGTTGNLSASDMAGTEAYAHHWTSIGTDVTMSDAYASNCSVSIPAGTTLPTTRTFVWHSEGNTAIGCPISQDTVKVNFREGSMVDCASHGIQLAFEDFGGMSSSDPDPSTSKPLSSFNPKMYTSLEWHTNILRCPPGQPTRYGIYAMTIQGLDNGEQSPGVLEWIRPYDHLTYPGKQHGYFMEIDGQDNAAIIDTFMRFEINDICPNSLLLFSYWSININNHATNYYDIETQILDDKGNILANHQTGKKYDWEWKQQSFLFPVPEGVETVYMQMINNQAVAGGNDFGIDDIEVRMCGNQAQAGYEPVPACDGGPVTLSGSINADEEYSKNYYRWFRSTDGNAYNPISDATESSYHINNVDGSYHYFLAVGGSQAIADNPGGTPCCVTSEPFKMQVAESPHVEADLFVRMYHESSKMDLDILTNDELPSGVTPEVSIMQEPLHGTAVWNPTKKVIEYQAEPGYVGGDTLVYIVLCGNCMDGAMVGIFIDSMNVGCATVTGTTDSYVSSKFSDLYFSGWARTLDVAFPGDPANCSIVLPNLATGWTASGTATHQVISAAPDATETQILDFFRNITFRTPPASVHTVTLSAERCTGSEKVGNGTDTSYLTLSGTTALCAPGTTDLTLTYSGTPPYSAKVVGTDGSVKTLTGISAASHSFTVNVAASTSYNITEFSDVTTCTCGRTPYFKKIGSADVTVYPPYTSGAIATTGQTICQYGTASEIGSTTPASGGHGTISYQWYVNGSAIDGATAATYTPASTFTNTAGSYTFTRKAKDETCQPTLAASTGSYLLTVNPQPAIEVTDYNSRCYGEDDGFITVNITSGTPNYTLTWTGGGSKTVTAAGSNTIENLADGSYVVSLTDAKNCTANTGAAVIIAQIANTLGVTADSQDFTYDGAAHTKPSYKVTFGAESYNASSGSGVTLPNGDVVTATISGSITNVPESPVTNAISSLTVTRGGSEITCYYNRSLTNGTLTMTKCHDCIKINVPETTEKMYDGDPLNPAATISDTIAGDVIKVEYSTDGGNTWTTDVPSITHVAEGPQEVQVRASSPNSDTVTANYTLTIDPRSVTLTSADSTKTYDGTALTNSRVVVTGDGFADGEGFTPNVTGSQTEAGSSSNVFTYTLNDGTTASDYNITPTPGTLTVNKCGTCLTWNLPNDTTHKYDGEHFGPATTATSTVTGDVVNVEYSVDGGATWSDTVPYVSHVADGSKTVTVRTTNPNYDTLSGSYTLTIIPRQVSLTSADSTKTYDGQPLTNSRVVVTGDGFADGEGFTPNVTGSQTEAGSSANAFTYELTGGAQATDYDITPTPGTLTVNKCGSCIKINVPETTEKIYDGDPLNPAATISDTIAGDVIKVEYSTDGGETWTTDVPSITHVAEGPQEVQVRASSPNSDTVTANYTLTIDPRSVTLTSADSTKTYDGTALTNSRVIVTGDGFADGEGFTSNVTGSQTEAGSSSNVFTYTLNDGTTASDYNITPTPGTLTVNKCGTCLTWNLPNDTTHKYDGEHFGPATTATSTVTGDVINVEYSVDGGATWSDTVPYVSHVADGSKTVTVRTTNPNYDTLSGSYTLTIIPRQVSLTSADSTKTYDGQPLTNSRVVVTGDGFADGEGFSPNVTGSITEAGSTSNTFTYELTGGAQATDYDITPTPGTLTVNKCHDCIKINVPETTEKIYDGTPLNPAVTLSDTIAGDVIKVEYSTDGGNTWTTDVPSVTHVDDTAHVIVRASSNNSDTVTANYTLTRSKRGVTLTSASDSKTFDGTPLTNHNVSISGDGFVGSEGCTTNVTGSQTGLGSSENTFTYTLKPNTMAVDYDIVKKFGILKVTDNTPPTFTRPEDVVVYRDFENNYSIDTSVTGDVTDEHDDTEEGLQATFHDETVSAPGADTIVIKRIWVLEDSMGNRSESDSVQMIRVVAHIELTPAVTDRGHIATCLTIDNDKEDFVDKLGKKVNYPALSENGKVLNACQCDIIVRPVAVGDSTILVVGQVTTLVPTAATADAYDNPNFSGTPVSGAVTIEGLNVRAKFRGLTVGTRYYIKITATDGSNNAEGELKEY